MSKIELRNIDKTYDGKNKIINNFNLKIKDGEFIVLLGESGCGKSTLLRVIAGLESISSGEILLDNKILNNLEPKDRDIAMVFQNYALYPHMTVYKNIAISLILKKIDKNIIDKKVDEVANILKISDLLDRKPRQLSGGQMQRVALARAMIRNPKVFLMDEPLSNLDSKLRVSIRSEIVKLYQKLKTTTIYVTHDQVEAMTMATTIVLMKDGEIIQKGSPNEMYSTPKHIYVAKFIGSPQINILSKKEIDYLLDDENINITKDNETYAIRPQHLTIIPGKKFKIDLIENLGNEKYIHISSNNKIKNKHLELVIVVNENDNFTINSDVDLIFDFEKIHKFDAETGIRKE